MSKGNSQRTWHAGKPIKKPDYNPDAVTEELVQAVVDCYAQTDEDGKHPSLSKIVEELPDYHLNAMKVRRILIRRIVLLDCIHHKGKWNNYEFNSWKYSCKHSF